MLSLPWLPYSWIFQVQLSLSQASPSQPPAKSQASLFKPSPKPEPSLFNPLQVPGRPQPSPSQPPAKSQASPSQSPAKPRQPRPPPGTSTGARFRRAACGSPGAASGSPACGWPSPRRSRQTCASRRTLLPRPSPLCCTVFGSLFLFQNSQCFASGKKQTPEGDPPTTPAIQSFGH